MLLRMLFLGITLVAAHAATAAEINPERARFNYQMFCRGCHTPEAMGKDDVPRINNYIGHFLTIEGGREYLVQVPGSANAAISDAQLTELLNWMILEFGGDSIPSNFAPYAEEEVAELRKAPLFEVVDKRKKLLKRIEHKQAKIN